MNETLIRIKRAILAGNFQFSEKALIEMEADDITDSEVVEAILSADHIYKSIRSRILKRVQRKELLHIIIGESLDGISIYTKGKLVREDGADFFYFLISSKRSD